MCINQAYSTSNLGDAYQGSGDWIKRWRLIDRTKLRTEPFRFFDSEAAVLVGEREYLAEIASDLRCQNISEGGDGRSSEEMRRTLARPEIKERHIAGVRARWAKQGERDRASAAARRGVQRSAIHAKYLNGAARRWGNPDEREKHAVGQQTRWARTTEREAQSARRRAYVAANPEAMVRNSEQKKALWADEAGRKKMLDAQAAGRGK